MGGQLSVSAASQPTACGAHTFGLNVPPIAKCGLLLLILWSFLGWEILFSVIFRQVMYHFYLAQLTNYLANFSVLLVPISISTDREMTVMSTARQSLRETSLQEKKK